MMTPQEVASHAFAKATLGGYNMAMVDEFLDALTEDYTALYNDNAILKNKLKVLSDTVEEYRATDNAMRKTLLAAQRMADSIVAEAEQKRSSLVQDAEDAAAVRVRELREQLHAEEARLKNARAATAEYAAKLRALQERQFAMLEELESLAPPEPRPAEPFAAAPQEPEAGEAPQLQPVPAAAPQPEEASDPDVTRRFEDLQFGQDYEIQ